MTQKWNLQDIVPPDRSKRNAERREGQASRQAPAREMRVAPQTPLSPKEPPRPMLDTMPPVDTSSFEEKNSYMNAEKTTKKFNQGDGGVIRKYIYGGLGLVAIGALGFLVTIILNGAEITVKPKTYDTTVQASFSAKLKPATGELGYEILTLTEEGERQVAAKGTEDVKQAAAGEITVFNSHSASSQRLIKSTRFEADGGRIYRITEAIDIPGYKKAADGTITPGSIKARVVADGTGESYNLTSGKLSVPGLKGSDQYTNIYAEVGVSGIVGGFEGAKFIIEEAELMTAKEALHAELKTKLTSRLSAERPNGFVVYEPAITFSTTSLPPGEGGSQVAIIKEQVSLVAPLFNETTFSSFIAKNTLAGYKGESVRLEDPTALTFAYDGEVPQNLGAAEAISFKLSGAIRVIWNFDSQALKEELKGAPESTLPAIFAKYEAIDKAKAVIRPIWKNTFPKDPEDIVITETQEIE
jgi:hypothetical protein